MDVGTEAVDTVCRAMRDGKLLPEITETYGYSLGDVMEVLKSLPAPEFADLMDDYMIVVTSRLAHAAVATPDKASNFKVALDAIKGLAAKLGARMATRANGGAARGIRIVKAQTKELQQQGPGGDVVPTASRPRVDYAALAKQAMTKAAHDGTSAADLVDGIVDDVVGGIVGNAASELVSDNEPVVKEVSGATTVFMNGQLRQFGNHLPAALRATGVPMANVPLADIQNDAPVPSYTIDAACDPAWRPHAQDVLTVNIAFTPDEVVHQRQAERSLAELRKANEEITLAPPPPPPPKARVTPEEAAAKRTRRVELNQKFNAVFA